MGNLPSTKDQEKTIRATGEKEQVIFGGTTISVMADF